MTLIAPIWLWLCGDSMAAQVIFSNCYGVEITGMVVMFLIRPVYTPLWLGLLNLLILLKEHHLYFLLCGKSKAGLQFFWLDFL